MKDPLVGSTPNSITIMKKEMRKKIIAIDIKALQIGCRRNWGELEKLRKLLELH